MSETKLNDNNFHIIVISVMVRTTIEIMAAALSDLLDPMKIDIPLIKCSNLHPGLDRRCSPKSCTLLQLGHKLKEG